MSFKLHFVALCTWIFLNEALSLAPSRFPRWRKTSFHLFSSKDPHSKSSDEDRRRMEFAVEPLAETETRRQRIERDLENRAQFVEFGNPLWDLRSKMDKLSSKLMQAINDGHDTIEELTRSKLRDFEKKDPELVYMLELADLEEASKEGRMTDADGHRVKAQAARSCLPHFNLEGLWVGKYGSHGYELINVTYVGDMLVAFKVTGDKNVPRGEITFQIDLHPSRQKKLQPIILTEKAAGKWGTRKLPRYGGLGQVAEEGFRNNQWMDGQLIIIGDEYFSFAWIPIEHQIFFGRPSPELSLKMFRENGVTPLRSAQPAFVAPPSVEDSVEQQKQFAMRCLELTDEIEDDKLGDGALSCIWHDLETDECYFE